MKILLIADLAADPATYRRSESPPWPDSIVSLGAVDGHYETYDGIKYTDGWGEWFRVEAESVPAAIALLRAAIEADDNVCLVGNPEVIRA